jgi:transposase
MRIPWLDAPTVTEGTTNLEMFLAYIELCLFAILKRNYVVAGNNFTDHKISGVRKAIENAGATLRYLPKYSPDLNPIESPCSKLNALLHKATHRTVREHYRTIRLFVPEFGHVPPASGMLHMFPYLREPPSCPSTSPITGIPNE